MTLWHDAPVSDAGAPKPGAPSPPGGERGVMRYLGAILAVGGLALSACDTDLGEPIFNRFSTADQESVSIDAHQRAIITTTLDKRARTIYCAEPSPDAFASIGRTIAGSLAAGNEAQQRFAAGLSDSVVKQASNDLSSRNATIQLLRDGLYRACEAYASGALRPNEYVGIVGQYQNVILALLSIEFLTNVNRGTERASSLRTGDSDPITSGTGKTGARATPKEDEGGDENEVAKVARSTAQTDAVSTYTPLSDKAIEKLADMAIAMVERVLSTEGTRALQPRLADCLNLRESDDFQLTKHKLNWCDQIFQRVVEEDEDILDELREGLEAPSERVQIGEPTRIDMLQEEVIRNFDFEVSDPGIYIIAVTAIPNDSGDPAILLATPDGQVIDRDDDSGLGLDARLEVTLENGFYELNVLNVGRTAATFELLIERVGDATGTAEESDDVVTLLEELLQEAPEHNAFPGADEAGESAQA